MTQSHTLGIRGLLATCAAQQARNIDLTTQGSWAKPLKKGWIVLRTAGFGSTSMAQKTKMVTYAPTDCKCEISHVVSQPMFQQFKHDFRPTAAQQLFEEPFVMPP